jgi:hypothetical protein
MRGGNGTTIRPGNWASIAKYCCRGANERSERAFDAPVVGSLRPCDYDGNTLLCRNESTRAVCHLWLYADGRYFVFYDRGPQQVMPAAGGNFRIEGRRGRYRLLPAASGFEVCLSPEPVPGKEFQIEKSGELFAGSACYELQRRSAGESWTQATGNGQTYRMWLVRGRG